MRAGVEVAGIDSAIFSSFNPPFPNHHYMNGANKFGLVHLTNVNKLPVRGTLLIVNSLKIGEGNVSPARAIALIEKPGIDQAGGELLHLLFRYEEIATKHDDFGQQYNPINIVKRLSS